MFEVLMNIITGLAVLTLVFDRWVNCTRSGQYWLGRFIVWRLEETDPPKAEHEKKMATLMLREKNLDKLIAAHALGLCRMPRNAYPLPERGCK